MIDAALNRAWAEIAAVKGDTVTVVLIDAGRYDVDTGGQASARIEKSVTAICGPVKQRTIESGAAVFGDFICQVISSELPRAPRISDQIVMDDGSTWTVKSTTAYGAIVEAIIGRS